MADGFKVENGQSLLGAVDMTHSWVLSLLGVPAGLVLFVLIPRRRAATPSVGEPTDEQPSLSLVGGGTWFTMWWPLGASWPFVRLDQFSWGVRIRPNGPWFRWMLPTTDLPWSEILLARSTRRTIRFIRRATPSYWVSFGPSVDPRLIIALREHGVSVQD